MTEKIELDEKKLTRMKMRIIQLERMNIKNKQKSRSAMIDEIRKIIATEVKRNI